MAHYMLFFPGSQDPDDAQLATAGLGGLVNTGVPIHWHQVLRGGPDGHDGMICCWCTGDPSRDADAGQHANCLWQPAKADRLRGLAAGRFYYGFNPASPPTPRDLALPKRYPGYDVEFADGSVWHIPAAIKLPHEHGINEDGVWERRVARRYLEFYDRSMEYGVQIFGQMDAAEVIRAANPDMPDDASLGSLTLEDADKHCCIALALNYRVTPEIVDYLGILDDVAMFAAISATIDLPQISEVLNQKKTQSRVAIRVG